MKDGERVGGRFANLTQIRPTNSDLKKKAIFFSFGFHFSHSIIFFQGGLHNDQLRPPSSLLPHQFGHPEPFSSASVSSSSPKGAAYYGKRGIFVEKNKERKTREEEEKKREEGAKKNGGWETEKEKGRVDESQGHRKDGPGSPKL